MNILLKLSLQVTLLAAGFAAQASGKFPTGPDDRITPGSLCTHPTEYRYPEHIPYCARSVEADTKRDIIHQYDTELGYSIESMNRREFKIDHLIPLCAGGSNERSNLWPQHQSVYIHTDRIEEVVCLLMSQGKMSQADVVHTVLDVKHHLETAETVLTSLLNRLGE